MKNENMKVAYLLGSLNRGGTETLMLDVLRNARKAPYEMICVHRKGGAYQEDFCAAGPTIYHLAPKRFCLIQYLWRLRKLFLREGVSIVHGQQPLDTIYGRLAALGTGIKVAQTFHGFYPMHGKAGLQTRLSIRMSDELCFVSRYEQEWYQKQMHIDDSKCHIIYNGIDFEKFKVIDDRCIDNRLTSIEDRRLEIGNRIRLCMVGNFMSGRDHRTLIHALRLLKERGIDNFDFYFIGRRSDAESYIYDECVRICEENKMSNIHFLGARSDVPALLKSMDGFVYSTDHDTFGIAVVEAMAAGLPVVVNDWPVMKEVCGDMASYFCSKDAEDCANAIEKLLAELPQRKEMALARAKQVREAYSIEAYLARLNAVYSVMCKV